ncbi:DUF4402 domain-containing protein [candidate division KSB1 bacterium]|nr:DUF4402 domain-containing protein [candidate division KSB1 bacterium]
MPISARKYIAYPKWERSGMFACRLLYILLLPVCIFAQTLNTSRATIGNALVAIAAQDLNFGSFTVGNSGGSITIDPETGMRSVMGAELHTIGGGYHPALFQLSGQRNAHYDVVMPGTVLLQRQGGTETMQVDTWTSFPLWNRAHGHRKLDKNGAADFSVGGTLHVNPNQSPGTYSGSFTITFTYN